MDSYSYWYCTFAKFYYSIPFTGCTWCVHNAFCQRNTVFRLCVKISKNNNYISIVYILQRTIYYTCSCSHACVWVVHMYRPAALNQNCLIMARVLWNESDIFPPLPGGSSPQKPCIAAATTDCGTTQDQDEEDMDSQNNASNDTIAQREDTHNWTNKGVKLLCVKDQSLDFTLSICSD